MDDGGGDGPSGFDPFSMLAGIFGGAGGASASGGGASDKSSGSRARPGGKARLVYAREKVERLVSVADNVVQQFVDRAAGMTPQERDMIVPPLAELVAESKELAKVAGFSNSISLVVGLGVWGFRIIMVWRFKHPSAPPQPEQQQPPSSGLPGIPPEAMAPGGPADDIFSMVREDVGKSRAFIIPNGADVESLPDGVSLIEVPITDFGAGGLTGHSKGGV